MRQPIFQKSKFLFPDNSLQNYLKLSSKIISPFVQLNEVMKLFPPKQININFKIPNLQDYIQCNQYNMLPSRVELPEFEQSFPEKNDQNHKWLHFLRKVKHHVWYITIIVLLVICVVYLLFSNNFSSTEYNPQVGESIEVSSGSQEFIFLVFCPKSSLNEKALLAAAASTNDENIRRRNIHAYANKLELKQGEDRRNFDPSRTYEVHITSSNHTLPDGTIETRLFYCGLTRGFYESDCRNAQYSCLSPNPMFDIPTGESIDIVWINELDPNFVPNADRSCFSPSRQGTPYCTLMAKVNRTQTYENPTKGMIDSKMSKQVQISPTSWPITTHVHGAEIRPTFDGNPLSWIDNNKAFNVGTGALSVSDTCYYKSFDQVDETGRKYTPPRFVIRNIFSNEITSNSKTNRYPNIQNPGTLWYHDHSMHLTSYNVHYGLSGFYILRDAYVQKQIRVPRQHEKLVMITQVDLTPSFSLSNFEADVVYRFRFLNNNFAGFPIGLWRISFSYNNCSDPFSERQSFSIIGADSSLFSISIDGQTSFVLSHAERMQILIKFKNQISFSICGDNSNTVTNSSETPSKESQNKFHGSQKKNLQKYNIREVHLKSRDKKKIIKTERTTIEEVKLDVPFTNFSQISDSEIAVQRMRPLMFMNGVLTINGRVDFHLGRSENPMLGSIQDWFFVNTMGFGHPIHIHLINFQVIKQYTVRTLQIASGTSKVLCSLYELDFIIQALKLAKDSNNSDIQSIRRNVLIGETAINYTFLCQNKGAVYKIQPFNEYLATIFPEDDTAAKVRGLNLLVGRTKQDEQNLAGLSFNPALNSSAFKYIVNAGAPSLKPYYSRWKDTAFVDGFKALQLRIRWTKSNFTEADRKAGTFFHVPADQLREYPGFLYHCHILDHEDNEMMRPIMLRLPENTLLNTNTTCNYDITSKQPVLRWSDKYNCVNKLCGNQLN